jgi:fumarylpyruvate hydrolase
MPYVFPPPHVSSVPVVGITERFAVNRIYCVGRNYEDHAKEMGHTGREPPFFFTKPANTIVPVAPGAVGDMPYPTLTANLHHEVELVVALGKSGKHIAAAQAASHIYGYAVGLDMTRRDLQTDMKKQGRPWCIGKAFDHASPIAAITPAAEAGDILKAQISLDVNDVQRQTSHIHQLIWSIAEIIEHLSSAWHLQAGDLIYTGTPAGVGAVVRGDLIHAHITGLNALDIRIS